MGVWTLHVAHRPFTGHVKHAGGHPPEEFRIKACELHGTAGALLITLIYKLSVLVDVFRGLIMDNKTALINRLRRIEGQIKGLQKMVDEEKYCSDILMQVSAVRSAVNNVGKLVLEQHLRECLELPKDEEDREQAIKELTELIAKYSN